MIVPLVVVVLFAFFSIASPNFRQYTTVLSILDYSYYIALMAFVLNHTQIGRYAIAIGKIERFAFYKKAK